MIGKADPPKPPQHVSTRKLGCTSEVRISSGFRHQPAKVRIYCTNWFPEGRDFKVPPSQCSGRPIRHAPASEFTLPGAGRPNRPLCGWGGIILTGA